MSSSVSRLLGAGGYRAKNWFCSYDQAKARSVPTCVPEPLCQRSYEGVGIWSCCQFSLTSNLESVSCDPHRPGRWQMTPLVVKKSWNGLQRGADARGAFSQCCQHSAFKQSVLEPPVLSPLPDNTGQSLSCWSRSPFRCHHLGVCC